MERILMAPAERRIDVVQRLLDAGLSPATLASMLPEFREVIELLTSPSDVSDARPLASAG